MTTRTYTKNETNAFSLFITNAVSVNFSTENLIRNLKKGWIE